MNKARVEAFSDGVIAVIITIMVLELKAPHGQDLAALAPLGPALLSYCLSFVYVGIYWNNHHHMLHAAQHIDGRVLWANLHLLESLLARAVGRDLKGKLSALLYAAAILLAFVRPWIADAIYVLVALIWFVPDRRFERAIE